MTYRFAVIAIAALCLSYASVQWLLDVRKQKPSAEAALMPGGAIPLKPSATVPSFRQVDPAEQQRTAFQGDDDEARNGLRRAVYDTASNLKKDPCNDGLKKQYIAAATKYARAQLGVAPCLARGTCNSDAEFAPLEKAFGTRFDDTLRDVMREVHGRGTIRDGDFDKDVVRQVAIMAKDIAINPDAPPAARRDWLEARGERSCQP